MVQLFKKDDENIELIQTMDDHVGAVGQLLFIGDGQRLLSCSADRTILVRDRVVREASGSNVIAYILTRVITLKSSPVSMTLMPDDSDILVFSTVDRCIQKYSLSTGRHISSFRASDFETNDAVVMSSLTVSAGIPDHSPRLLLGVSASDRSIRVYDIDREVLLTGEFGHTEGASGLYLLDGESASADKRLLVSAGIDGVIMIWSLSVQPQYSKELCQSCRASPQDDERTSPTTKPKEMTAAKPPLRRVLSKLELANFQRTDNQAASPSPSPTAGSLSLRNKASRQSLTPSSLRTGNALSTPPPRIYARRSSLPSPTDRGRNPPSPVSPRARVSRKPIGTAHEHRRNWSGDTSNSAKDMGRDECEGLDTSTEEICKSLRAYREKLHSSTEEVHLTKDLERELNLTLHVLTSHTKNKNNPRRSPNRTEPRRRNSGEETKSMVIRPSPTTTSTTTLSVPVSDTKKPRASGLFPPTGQDLRKKKARHFPRSRSTGRDG